MSNLETFYNKLDKTFKEFNKNKKTIDLTLNIYPKYPTIYSMANMFLFAHEETALLPDKIKTINIKTFFFFFIVIRPNLDIINNKMTIAHNSTNLPI